MPDLRKNPELIDEFPKFALDDEVELGCKGCGKCCKNRQDLILTPLDVFRIAKYLGKTTQYVVEQYCEVYIGDTSYIPVARMVPVPPDAVCPFLRGKRCSIHAAKPAPCKLFPFSRVFGLDGEEDATYLLNGSCGEHPPLQKQTLRSWAGDTISDEMVSISRLWTGTLYELFEMMTNATKKWKAPILELFNSVLCVEMYVNYDINESFLPQFTRNINKAREIYSMLDAIPETAK